MIECRAVAAQLEGTPGQESQAVAAERIAYGVLVASLEEGLVTTRVRRPRRAEDIALGCLAHQRPLSSARRRSVVRRRPNPNRGVRRCCRRVPAADSVPV